MMTIYPDLPQRIKVVVTATLDLDEGGVSPYETYSCWLSTVNDLRLMGDASNGGLNVAPAFESVYFGLRDKLLQTEQETAE